MRSLQNPAERREARPDVLDTPVLPGSVMKVVTLVAALESRVDRAGHDSRMCRRTVTVDGRKYVCSHPDLKRPLSAGRGAGAFVQRLLRVAGAATAAIDGQRRARATRACRPLADSANLPASLVGLDGPRMTPRALLDVMARLAGADPQRPVASL